jgi:hypothetical protein
MMKHEAAFACVRLRLVTRFPDNISVEPRYAPGLAQEQSVLTGRWTGSLIQVSLYAREQEQPTRPKEFRRT